MHPDFWHERWEQGQIGFHRASVHPDLVAETSWFLDDAPHRVLVPLCGKSLDVPWLAARGHTVVGSELSAIAARELFAEHDLEATTREEAEHVVWSAGSLEVWQGDFFALPDELAFDRVWDRAALVALPPTLREAYVAKVKALAPGATVLLNVLDYDPEVMSGPPFPVTHDDVERLYAGNRIERLAERDLVDQEPRWRERGHTYFTSRLYRIVFE